MIPTPRRRPGVSHPGRPLTPMTAPTKTYEQSANSLEPVAEELIHDLDNIISITRWAEEEAAIRMTLEVKLVEPWLIHNRGVHYRRNRL
jgi:hypothetical protein